MFFQRSVGNSGCKNYKLEIILQQYWELSVKGTTQDTLEFCGGQFGIYQGETVPSVVRSNTEHKITMYLNFEIFREITQIHEFVCLLFSRKISKVLFHSS